MSELHVDGLSAGSAPKMVADDERLYPVGVGPGLVTVDVHYPAAPREIARAQLYGLVDLLAAADGLVLARVLDLGEERVVLAAISVRRPAVPVVLAMWPSLGLIRPSTAVLHDEIFAASTAIGPWRLRPVDDGPSRP